MTSSWLSRACVVVVVVSACAVLGGECSTDDRRRTSSPDDRTVLRLCDAILADDDDVSGARKRKWGENTMMTWGKRGIVGAVYALSVCESLGRSLGRLQDRSSISTWGNRKNDVDTKDPTGWLGNDVKVAEMSSNPDVKAGVKEEAIKRRWGENSMATWGKRRS